MSLDFIFDLVIVLCIGAMLYLVARVLPRINEEKEEVLGFKTPKMLVYLEKADERFKRSKEKFLRKLRVIVLKLDNYLSNKLSKFKKNGEKNGGLRLDLDKDSSYSENKERDNEEKE
jgi:hypothetical protein